MTQVSARGINIDTDGLGMNLRVNGVIATPAPDVSLRVNGSKVVTGTEDTLKVHPSGGYTDVHYTLSEKVYAVDIAYATSFTNQPLFNDKKVFNNVVDGSVSEKYEYTILVAGDGGTNIGYSAIGVGGLTESEYALNRVHGVYAEIAGGAVFVNFGDEGGEKVAEAITVEFEGLDVFLDGTTDEERFPLRLEYSDANHRYELPTSVSAQAVADYLVAVTGASVGLNIVYHF